MATWQPSPEHAQQQAAEKTERDYATALAVLQEAVKSFGGHPAPDDEQVVIRAEKMWRWLTTDGYPIPGDE